MDFELEELLIEEPVFDFLNKEKQSDFPITNYLRKFEKELTKAEEIIEKLHRSLLDFLINEGIVLNFPEFTNILILQILRNKNVYLGDIPLNAYKIILADALDLKVLIKSFEDTIKHLKNFGSENRNQKPKFRFMWKCCILTVSINISIWLKGKMKKN